MNQLDAGLDRDPPKPTGGEVVGGVLLLALATGALLGALLLDRDPDDRGRPRAQLTAAVQPAPQAPEPVVGIEQTAPAGMLRPE